MLRKDENETDGFKKRREEFSIGIRRQLRKDTFNKRRNLGNFEIETSNGTAKEEESVLIIDERYRQQIQEMINYDYDSSMFGTLTNLLNSSEILEIHRGIIGIRKILAADSQPPIQEFIDHGLLQKCFQLVNQNQFPQLKLEAVWALTNVASGQTKFCGAVVDKGGIELFIRILNENEKGIVDQGIWAIGNIAADQTLYRDQILKMGGLEIMLKIVQSSTSNSIIKNGTWAITNLCRGTPPPKYELAQIAIPTLCKVVINSLVRSKEVTSDCLWTLSYLCQGAKSRIQRVIETGITPKLCEHVLHEYNGFYVPSLRTLGNFSTGNQLHTEELINNGMLNIIQKLLSHPKSAVRRQVCWIASNLAAGTASQVQRILGNESFLKKMIDSFETDVEEVKRQICWVFSNIGYLGPKKLVIQMYQKADIMRLFVNLLSSKETLTLDTALECLYKILLIGLKASENNKNLMLEQMLAYNGAERLSQLQHHQSAKVYQRTVKILQRFFVISEQQNFV